MSIDIKDRLRGAIWGQLVGDAACPGAHWIYDLSEIQDRFSNTDGFDTPTHGHYHYGRRAGDQTHYGDAALLMLESVASLGHFDPSDFGRRFVHLFASAGYRGYLDRATRGTLENYKRFQQENPKSKFDFQQGADDEEGATATRLAPVVVAHWKDPQLTEVVATATRVTQNNARAVAYMKANANILRELLGGASLQTAFANTAEWITSQEPELGTEVRDKIELARTDTLQGVIEATLAFGQSCPLPRTFPAAIHAAAKHPESYRDAVLATLKAGGDNAQRAAILGAWMGALLGYQAIPKNWRTKLNAHIQVEQWTEELLGKLKL